MTESAGGERGQRGEVPAAANDDVVARIGQAESEVGAALALEVRGYLDLVPELTRFGNRLVGSIEPGVEGLTAQHAVAILLTRVLTELQAVAHLTTLGYPVQALTLTGTMLEVCHAASYIGADEDRATQWYEHTDTRSSYPRSVKAAIAALAARIEAPKVAELREYEVIYRQICMAKHAHPIALGQTTTVLHGDTLYLFTEPHHCEQLTRVAHMAMQYGARYAFLTCLAFLQSHRSGVQALPFVADLEHLNRKYTALVQATAVRFAPKG